MTSSTVRSPAFMHTDRDYRLMADVGRCNGLTAEQISVQHFNLTVVRVYNKQTRDVERLESMIHANCQKRLKLLKDNGYLRRIQLYQMLKEGKKPYFYVLTRLGAQTVASYLGCTIEETGWRERDPRLRSTYVQHHIKINDIRLALTRAIEGREDLALVRWYDEVELNKIHSTFTVPLKVGNKTEDVKLFPDACFVLRGSDGKERYHFVEVDTGTETTASRNDLYRTFATMMTKYKSFIFTEGGRQSVFSREYGAPTARILTITTSAERRQRLITASEEVGAQRVFWFTTHPQVTTPSIVSYQKRNGEEAYRAVMPDILSDPMWLIAKDRDEQRPEHALDEPFKRIAQQ